MHFFCSGRGLRVTVGSDFGSVHVWVSQSVDRKNKRVVNNIFYQLRKRPPPETVTKRQKKADFQTELILPVFFVETWIDRLAFLLFWFSKRHLTRQVSLGKSKYGNM